MPNEILLAILIVSGIGLVIGIALAIASIVLAVPTDEKVEAVKAELPGANCGGCGFSGCESYAKAIAAGEAEVNLCPVGGKDVAMKLGEIMGVEVGDVEQKVAVVRCMGSKDNTERRFNYQGSHNCRSATNLVGNLSSCVYGCIGLGDCLKVCPYGGIEVCNGVARIITENCRGCGMCAKACPKNLIALVPLKEQALVRCQNFHKGALTRKDCNVGCIGCMKCVKVCEAGAVEVKNFNAVVDPKKCTSCGKCLEACPRGCITPFTV
ncbi:MAG: RnfABCDGE type electron transport complex subunit B [Clostridia bacterium]|nr:RnfABCDGE type electron transport complex subunit B [Clostridia bacterium]